MLMNLRGLCHDVVAQAFAKAFYGIEEMKWQFNPAQARGPDGRWVGGGGTAPAAGMSLQQGQQTTGPIPTGPFTGGLTPSGGLPSSTPSGPLTSPFNPSTPLGGAYAAAAWVSGLRTHVQTGLHHLASFHAVSDNAFQVWASILNYHAASGGVVTAADRVRNLAQLATFLVDQATLGPGIPKPPWWAQAVNTLSVSARRRYQSICNHVARAVRHAQLLHRPVGAPADIRPILVQEVAKALCAANGGMDAPADLAPDPATAGGVPSGTGQLGGDMS